MYKLVGLTGKAGSGKDTAAQGLTDHHMMKFAEGVYNGVWELNPWVPYGENPKTYTCKVERLQGIVTQIGWDKAKENQEVRRFLQAYGTEAGRDIHGPDCWVNAWKRRLAEQDKTWGARNVVVTDVRFPNEADAIKELGGVVIEIMGPPRRGGVDSTHASEAGIGRRADMTLVNEGSVEELHQRIRKLVGYET